MSVALIGVGVLQTIVYLLFVRTIDLYEREDFRYVIPVFVWGFTVAVTISLIFNTVIGAALSALTANPNAAPFLTAVFVAPPVEEISKGLALLIAFGVASAVALRRGGTEFSGVMDGIVYGSAVGFGFSIAEDILYYAQTYQQVGDQVFIARRIFGGFAHAAFTSLTGIGIGLIPWVRSYVLKVTLPLLGLAAAIFLHASFNFTASLFGPVVYAALFGVLLLYAVIIVVWLAVERRTIRSELRDEVGYGTISQSEYSILPTYFARTFYYLGLLLTGRLTEWRRARRMHQAAVDLAFTKRLAREPYAPSQGQKEQYLRQRIKELRFGRKSRPASY
ncbi:MAG: PrsW family intramembrane metalloprotease [Actinomycetota bacterium]|nr:PrsW family intramembrane metalloprotease [Actinomycetota bacterium]